MGGDKTTYEKRKILICLLLFILFIYKKRSHAAPYDVGRLGQCNLKINFREFSSRCKTEKVVRHPLSLFVGDNCHSVTFVWLYNVLDFLKNEISSAVGGLYIALSCSFIVITFKDLYSIQSTSSRLKFSLLFYVGRLTSSKLFTLCVCFFNERKRQRVSDN